LGGPISTTTEVVDVFTEHYDATVLIHPSVDGLSDCLNEFHFTALEFLDRRIKPRQRIQFGFCAADACVNNFGVGPEFGANPAAALTVGVGFNQGICSGGHSLLSLCSHRFAPCIVDETTFAHLTCDSFERVPCAPFSLFVFRPVTKCASWVRTILMQDAVDFSFDDRSS